MAGSVVEVQFAGRHGKGDNEGGDRRGGEAVTEKRCPGGNSWNSIGERPEGDTNKGGYYKNRDETKKKAGVKLPNSIVNSG